jgi:hypothetical protein
MKKVLTTLAALAFCTLASADTASDLFGIQKSVLKNPNSVYGVWEVPTMNVSTLKITMRMRIDQNQVIAGIKCEEGGHVAMVALTVPATITADTITMNASAQQDVKQDGVDCNASVQAGEIAHYKVANGVLTVDNTPAPANKIAD